MSCVSKWLSSYSASWHTFPSKLNLKAPTSSCDNFSSGLLRLPSLFMKICIDRYIHICIHNLIYSDVINYSWSFLILFILRRRRVEGTPHSNQLTTVLVRFKHETALKINFKNYRLLTFWRSASFVRLQLQKYTTRIIELWSKNVANEIYFSLKYA